MPEDHPTTIPEAANNFYDVGAPNQLVQPNGATASRPKSNGATASRPKSNGATASRPKSNGATASRPKSNGATASRPKSSRPTGKATAASGHQRNSSHGQGITADRDSAEGQPPALHKKEKRRQAAGPQSPSLTPISTQEDGMGMRTTSNRSKGRRSLPARPKTPDNVIYEGNPTASAANTSDLPAPNHGNGGGDAAENTAAPLYAVPVDSTGQRRRQQTDATNTTASHGARLYANKEDLQGGNPEPAEYNVLAPRTETANDNTAVASTQNHTELTAATTSNGLPQNSVIYMAANPGQLAEGNAAALYTVTNATQEGHIPATRDERNNLVFVRAPTGPDYAEPNVNQQDGTVTRANQLYSGQGSFSVNDDQGSFYATPNFNDSGPGQVPRGTSFMHDDDPQDGDVQATSSCWPCLGGGSNAADANTQPPHAYANPAYEGNQLQNNPRLAVNGIYGERNPTALDGFQREVEGLAGQTADSDEDTGEPVIHQNAGDAAGDAGDAAGNAGITTANDKSCSEQWNSLEAWQQWVIILLCVTLIAVVIAAIATNGFNPNGYGGDDNNVTPFNESTNCNVTTEEAVNTALTAHGKGDPSLVTALFGILYANLSAAAAMRLNQSGLNSDALQQCQENDPNASQRIQVALDAAAVADDDEANDDVDVDDHDVENDDAEENDAVDNDGTPAETTPEAKKTTPEAKETTPEAKETTPEAKETTPETKETTPEAKETTPETKETTPEAKETTPATTAKPKTPAPTPAPVAPPPPPAEPAKCGLFNQGRCEGTPTADNCNNRRGCQP